MATKQKINFGDWAAGMYSREVRGHVQGSEFNDGVPIEIPIQMQRPETLDQQIMRLVRAYSRDTGEDVETIDEANDFAIPGEDEDYEEDDYIVQAVQVRNAGTVEDEEHEASPDSIESGEGTRQEADAPAASVVPSDESPAQVKKTRSRKAQ